MVTLSATCLAIAIADRANTLRLEESKSRFGGTYIAICDEVGIIEVANDLDAANKRLAEVRARRGN